ncbi:hypothetical protein MTR67_044788 [Solanum verrucosum]|uniref:Uncharacterized protein n=1 Tax=Solanum verrucosum TaxID=315347 RepID=A0AAF0UU46_SOLVR|nr:hypothetical protein MTR67_044788 [Solanum verrucosum]
MMTLESVGYLVPKTSLGRFVGNFSIVLYIFVISGGIQKRIILMCLTTLRVVSMRDQ